uniref:Unannotated protein n=1 Tax=freshwater metagenome TaxID=449393 RepID=A0A6J6A1I5_9ZZZZ
MGADRVEERQRTAAGADHKAKVAVKLGDVACNSAVVLGVYLFAGKLKGGGLARFARLLIADAKLGQQLLVAAAGLVLHVHVRVERDERSVGEAADRVDLGQSHVVVDEELCQLGDDRDQLVQLGAADAGGGDHFLRFKAADRAQV